MNPKIFSTVAVLAAVLSGCATVTRGTVNQIQITSEPSQANVRTSTNFQCTTPCTLTVDRKSEFQVVFSKAGYEDQTINVRTQLAGAGVAGAAGNILIGGVVGLGVDAVTGATLEHVPNPVFAQLVALRGAPSARRPANRPAPRVAPAPRMVEPETAPEAPWPQPNS